MPKMEEGHKTSAGGIVLTFVSFWLITFFLGVQFYPVIPSYSIAYITSNFCPFLTSLESFNYIITRETGATYQSPFLNFLQITSAADLCTKFNIIVFFSYVSLLIGVVGLGSGLYLILKR